jgi:hypothetical protein
MAIMMVLRSTFAFTSAMKAGDLLMVGRSIDNNNLPLEVRLSMGEPHTQKKNSPRCISSNPNVSS